MSWDGMPRLLSGSISVQCAKANIGVYHLDALGIATWKNPRWQLGATHSFAKLADSTHLEPCSCDPVEIGYPPGSTAQGELLGLRTEARSA